jgi:HPt (histidine-containing phosphotransfer) domain-containing protein
MDEKDKILEIFSRTNIDGLNLTDGVARFGGNPKLYVKIIKTFADNIEPHLDTLAALTPDGLESYGIEVHGVKGSCYGISAGREGDMARDLEMAAKASDFDRVAAGNARFIAAVNELKDKLLALIAEVESGEGGGQMKPEPDKETLAAMLQASRDFDVDKMQEVLKELEKYEYETGSELVKWLGQQVTAFGYDRIEERLVSIL